MIQLDSTLEDITKFVYSVSIGCYNLKFQEPEEKELFFAKIILINLNNNQELFSLLSKMHRQNLSDSIKTHGARYLQEYLKYPRLTDDALLFEKCNKEVLEKLSSADKCYIELENTKLDFLSERFYNIIKKMQLFFSNQAKNQDSLEYIHALSIVYRIKNIDFAEQNVLVELLMSVKELWNMDYNTNKDNEFSIAEKFYLNPANFLQIDTHLDAATIFNLVVNLFLTSDDPILIYLHDEQILSLYDRLKNYEAYSDSTTELMYRIHDEAQFRYSYNRLSTTAYALLNRFQTFDAINNQIENLEFYILEAYIFKKANFTMEILVNIAKHSDNIKALSLNKNEKLQKIFEHINKKLSITSKKHNGGSAMLTSLKDSLSKILQSHVKKRYAELDKFTKYALQKKYSDLFANLVSLFNNTDDSKKFLQKILTQRLANDYYLPNLSNSIDKLRIMALNRKEILSLLSELNFLDIFTPGHFNKITSFNFIKKDNNTELKAPQEYVKSLINDMTLYSNAFQLETLYKSVIRVHETTNVQSMLIDAIKTQINQRMTIRKMLYSIISGKKKEYDKLKSLKQISTQSALNA